MRAVGSRIRADHRRNQAVDTVLGLFGGNLTAQVPIGISAEVVFVGNGRVIRRAGGVKVFES